MSSVEHHKYEYVVDSQADNAAARVLRYVGHDKRVIEVGAGPGSITRALAGAGRCEVTAVDIDATAIERLSPYCKRVLLADLNQSDWSSALADEPAFDVLVAADVLEHVYDPWATLSTFVKLVRPDGHLVISLPHAGHAVVAASLLSEDFRYAQWGLLDRTHIRFFGIHNVQALFERAGLKIVEAEFVIRAPEDTELADIWAGCSKAVQSALLSNPFATVYQVVVKAVPSSSTQPGIRLIEQPVGQPHISALTRLIPHAGFRTALRRSVRASWSPQTISWIRRMALKVGMRL